MGGGMVGVGGQRTDKTGFPKNHAIQLPANPLCWTFYLQRGCPVSNHRLLGVEEGEQLQNKTAAYKYVFITHKTDSDCALIYFIIFFFFYPDCEH